MPKTYFENLKVYQLAEKLADEIWEIVIKWDYLAKNTVGQQIVRSADGMGHVLLKEAVGGQLRTIVDSSVSLAVHFTRRSTGLDVPSSGNF